MVIQDASFDLPRQRPVLVVKNKGVAERHASVAPINGQIRVIVGSRMSRSASPARFARRTCG